MHFTKIIISTEERERKPFELSTTNVDKHVHNIQFYLYLCNKIQSPMKKIFNKAWIGVVALTTLIVGACCTGKNTNDNGLSKAELKERIDNLKSIVKDREMSCVYGSPEIIAEYGRETARLRHELDSLQKVYDDFDNRK